MISKEFTVHWYGGQAWFEDYLAFGISMLEGNAPSSLDKLGLCLKEISQSVLLAAKKPHAWFCLKASFPRKERFVPVRWHMDGFHYKAEKEQIKFCTTLKGESTWFSFIKRFNLFLRQEVWRNMNNPWLTQKIALEQGVFKPRVGEGVWFFLANYKIAALHTEPDSESNRLFFSIVPCLDKDLGTICDRVQAYYPPDAKNIFFFENP